VNLLILLQVEARACPSVAAGERQAPPNLDPHKVDVLTYMMMLGSKGRPYKLLDFWNTTPTNPRQVQRVGTNFYSSGRRDVFLPPLFILAFRLTDTIAQAPFAGSRGALTRVLDRGSLPWGGS
jgi:hypothetical protein